MDDQEQFNLSHRIDDLYEHKIYLCLYKAGHHVEADPDWKPSGYKHKFVFIRDWVICHESGLYGRPTIIDVVSEAKKALGIISPWVHTPFNYKLGLIKLKNNVFTWRINL